MAYEAGTAFLQVVPSFSGVVTAISDEFTKYGEEAASVFNKSFKETVKQGTKDTEVGPSDSDTAKKGESAGGKFANAFKARVDAALKSLPDATVDLNDEEAKLKLDDIRARLETLRNVNIGVDIKDIDALAAIEVLQVDLAELAVRSPDIRIHVDAAQAITELEAVKVAADEASGEKSAGGAAGGLAGVGSSVGELGSALPVTVGVILLLGTALIPIGALALGAAIGLAAMATAATAGLGAFAIAALPVFSKVSGALQQISTDQNAVNRATTATGRNTALTHLYDDLSQLSPVVRTVTLGVLQAKQVITDWSAQFDPLIIRVFNAAVADLQPILTAITPLVTAGGNALVGFFQAIGQATQQADFKQFIGWLATQVGPAVQSFTKTFLGFAAGFSKLFENSGPLIKQVEKALPNLASAFERFAASKTFKDFIDWVVRNGPNVVKEIVDIAGAIGKVITVLAPIGLVVLKFIDVITKAYVAFLVFNVQVWTEVYHAILDAWHWIKDNVFDPIGSALGGLGGVMDVLQRDWDNAWSAVSGAVATAWSAMQPIINLIKGAVNDVKAAIDVLTQSSAAGTYSVPSGPQSVPAPTTHRASGGTVAAGHAYAINEYGQEGFVPAVSGRIISAHDLAGMSTSHGARGPAIVQNDVHYHDEASIDVLTRKADFAMRAGVL